MKSCDISQEYLEKSVSEGKTRKEMLKELGVSNCTLSKALKRCGLKSKGKRKTNKIVIEIGNKYNNLKVLEELPIEKRQHRKFLCQCNCGNLVKVKICDLKDGQLGCKQCGYKIAGNKNWKGYEEISGGYWCCLKIHAERRGISFNITIEEAWLKFVEQNRKCALSGIIIYFAPNRTNKKYGTASLDRIDSSKPYISNNIQWVHKTVNVIKMALDEEELIYWCHHISNNNPHRGKNVPGKTN